VEVDKHQVLKKGDYIKIDGAGLIGTKRRDGCTFFGTYESEADRRVIDVNYISE